MATASSQNKTDRRVRRTKTLLTDALFSLLKEKSYKDITVKELCDTADINRGTFYLHYKDIYDMVEQIEQEVLSEFETLIFKYTSSELTVSPYPLLYDIFAFADSNRALYTALLGKNGDISFLTKVKGLFRDRLLELYISDSSEMSLSRFEYLYSFIAAGCIGTIERWLLSNQPETPEEMASLTNDIITNGLRSLK